MNTSLFIAKRLIKGESTQKGLSGPIVRIATIGIALGMAVMIVAVAIVIGFQNEIRQKVIGFGSHIQITNFGSGEGISQPKLEIDQEFYPHIDTLEGVQNIQLYALKEGVIETEENIQGIIIKGVAGDYDWGFFEENLVEGKLPDFSNQENENAIVLSKFLSSRLGLELGSKVSIYFQNAQGGMSQRNFELKAIYETGLQDLDEQFVIVNLDVIRKINQWGLEANLLFEGCRGDSVVLKGFGRGGDGDVRLVWSRDSIRGNDPQTFCLSPGEIIYVVAKDRSETISDTAFFKIKSSIPDSAACLCPGEDSVEIWNSGGSAKYYTGGFEIMLEGFEDLDKMDQLIYDHLNYDLQTSTIKQKSPEIFNWLEMLDLNTAIIITLMILISVINMTSALLILIMERTQMIGILKTLGASGWFVQKIFLNQAAYIILLGMGAGNAIGIVFCLLQDKYGFIKLDPENYYVSEVPVLIRLEDLFLLNAGTFAVCLLMMILPSLAANRIRPSKAIRFN